MKKETNFLYIKPLYNLCSFLAITPPHTFGQDVTAPSWGYKCYTLVHVVIVFVMFLHSHRGRQATFYLTMESTVAIVDRIANVSMSSFAILLRLLTVFYNGKNIKQFINTTYKISLRSEFSCISPGNFWAQLIGFHLYMGFLVGFNTWVWLKSLGMPLFQFYVGRSVFYYICNLSFFLMFHFAMIIKQHFLSLNDLLQVTTKALLWDERSNLLPHLGGLVSSDFKINPPLTNSYQYNDLKKIGQFYNGLCELVDRYNKLFGLVILMVIFVVMTFVLNMVDLFLVYAIHQNKGLEGAHYGPELIVVGVSWSLTFLLFPLLVAFACEGAIAESGKTSIICFGWLNQIPMSTKSSKCQIIKEELLLLAHHTSSQRPKFSAAGFFDVDFTLLGFVVGSVTSYIIVTMQFIK